MADYTTIPPFSVGQLLGAADMEKIRNDIPYVQDFPAYSVSNTLVATDILQGAFVVPSAQMGSNRHLWVWAEGTLKCTSTQAAPAWSVLYGSTTMLDTGLGNHNLQGNAQLGHFQLVVQIQMSNATNAQVITIEGRWSDGNDNGEFTVGRGINDTVGAGVGGFISGRNTTAVNMAVGGVLALKARCPVSNNNYVVGMLAAKAWIL